MSLDTYDGLRAAIASTLNKTNLTASIPNFITLAEATMRREITSVSRIDSYPEVEVTEDGWALPITVDEVASVIYADKALGYLSPDRIDDVTGSEPGYYTVDGRTLRVAPTGTVNIRVRTTFPALSDSLAYNWLLREHPDVYLYGALLQAAPFLRDDERILVWGRFFANAIDSINRREIRRQTGGVLRVQAGVTP